MMDADFGPTNGKGPGACLEPFDVSNSPVVLTKLSVAAYVHPVKTRKSGSTVEKLSVLR